MKVDIVMGRLVIRGDPGELGLLENLGDVSVYDQVYDPRTDTVSLERSPLRVAAVLDDAAVAKPVLLPLLLDQAAKLGIRVELGPGAKKLMDEIDREIEVADSFPWTLRPYQLEAWERFKKTKKLMVVLPTGTGKTLVALYAIWKLRRPALVLVPNNTLVGQWLRLLHRVVRSACFYQDGVCDVTVATYQAFRRSEELSRFYFIVSDEGHHLPAKKWSSFVVNGVWPARLVLSATPERRDRNHELLEWFVGWNIYRRTYRELASQGWVAPLEITVVKLPPANPQLVEDLLMKYSYARDTGAGAAKAKAELRRVLLEDPLKERVLVDMVSGETGKTIVFVEYVDQAYRVAEKLGAEVITGREPPEKRDRALARFRQGLVRALVVTSAAEEGVDVPDADNAYMLTVPSERQLIQRLGRIMRPKPMARAVFLLTVPGQNNEIGKLRRILGVHGIDSPVKIYRARL